MRGWKAIITDSAADEYLTDPFRTDDRASPYAPGAVEDPTDRWSYSLLDADLAIHGSSLPIDSYRQTGWLAFACPRRHVGDAGDHDLGVQRAGDGIRDARDPRYAQRSSFIPSWVATNPRRW